MKITNAENAQLLGAHSFIYKEIKMNNFYQYLLSILSGIQNGAAPTAVYNQKNQDTSDVSIFSKLHCNSNDSMGSASIGALKSDVGTMLNNYPNLKDNLSGIGDVYIVQDKNAVNLAGTNLSGNLINSFMKPNTVGCYTQDTHQMVVQIPKVNGQDREDIGFRNFAHEFAHSIDYADLNNNGTSADDVSPANYGTFSASKAYTDAFYKDLKQLEGVDVENKYPRLANVLNYPLQEVNFSDGIDGKDMTYHGVRESFAFLASQILTGEDQYSGISSAMPNCYAMTKQKLANS